jgi:hypothetical protein
MSLVVVIPLALGGTLDVPKRVYLSYTQTSYTHTHTDMAQNVLRLNSWILLSLEKVFFSSIRVIFIPTVSRRKIGGLCWENCCSKTIFFKGREREPWRET